MRAIQRTSLSFLIVIGLSGCCINGFSTIAAVNESESTILVKYTHPCQPRIGWARNFVLVKSDLIHRRESAGKPANFLCADDEMTVELPPSYAVTVYTSVRTRPACIAPDYEERKISLIGANGVVSFSNEKQSIDSVMDRFQKLSSDLYVITYH